MNAYSYAVLFQILIFFSMTVHARLTTIASTGEQAADFPSGYEYGRFTSAIISNSGEVVFSSFASGDIHPDLNCETLISPTQQSCHAIWLGKPGTLKTAIKQGEPISGFPFEAVFDAPFKGTEIISDAGFLGFAGTIKVNGIEGTAIMAHFNGNNYGVVYRGMSAPGFAAGTTFSEEIDNLFRLSDAGLGFMAKISNGIGLGIDTIWFWDKTELKLIAAEEQEVSDLFPGCPIISTPLSPRLLDINNAGEVLFLVNFDTKNSNCPSGGLFTWKNGNYKTIAIDGDTSQDIGMPEGTSFAFTLPDIEGFSGEINDNGDVLFSAKLRHESFGTSTPALYDSVWIAHNNGEINPVLFAGEDIQGLPNTQTSGELSYGNIGMNGNSVAIIKTGISNRVTGGTGGAILVGQSKRENYDDFEEIASATNLEAIVYSGAPVPILGDNWSFSFIDNALMNNNQVVVFNAHVQDNFNDFEEVGVWIMDAQGNLDLIALNDNNQFVFVNDIGGDGSIYLYKAHIDSGVISNASTLAILLVQKAYLAYYGRPGDPAGIDYWAQKLDAAGRNWTHEILATFGNSEEFQTRFGNLSNEELINNIYLQLFNRPAEPAGLDYFVNLLQSGQSSLSQIAVDIINGAIGDDALAINYKLSACDYFTQKVANGEITYDSIDLIKAIIANINNQATNNTALNEIDAIANQ